METRECKGCGIVQPVTDFPVREVSKKTGKTLYRYKCRPCELDRVGRWHKENGEARKRHAKSYYENNKEKALAASERWAKENPAAVKAKDARRRAAKALRYPLWADRVEIDYVYHAAQVIKDVYGTTWHVDHIVPLQGEKVSGLHVASNLQLLSPEANLSKSNKFEVM